MPTCPQCTWNKTKHKAPLASCTFFSSVCHDHEHPGILINHTSTQPSSPITTIHIHTTYLQGCCLSPVCATNKPTHHHLPCPAPPRFEFHRRQARLAGPHHAKATQPRPSVVSVLPRLWPVPMLCKGSTPRQSQGTARAAISTCASRPHHSVLPPLPPSFPYTNTHRRKTWGHTRDTAFSTFNSAAYLNNVRTVCVVIAPCFYVVQWDLLLHPLPLTPGKPVFPPSLPSLILTHKRNTSSNMEK